MKRVGHFLLAGGLVFTFNFAKASVSVIRATELGPGVWAKVIGGQMKDAVVEFRAGDELPIQLKADGDLMDTKTLVQNTVTIKRNFWIRPTTNNLEISFDKVTFQKFSDALTGTLKVDSGADENGGPANFINILFSAYLRN